MYRLASLGPLGNLLQRNNPRRQVNPRPQAQRLVLQQPVPGVPLRLPPQVRLRLLLPVRKSLLVL